MVRKCHPVADQTTKTQQTTSDVICLPSSGGVCCSVCRLMFIMTARSSRFAKLSAIGRARDCFFDEIRCVLEKLEEIRDWESLDKCIWVCWQ